MKYVFAVLAIFCLTQPRASAAPADLPSATEVSARTISLLQAEKYDELEALGARYRQMNDFVLGGKPAINIFYLALTSGPDLTIKETKVRRWIELNPNSDTAHVVLARILDNYGWQVRGEKIASQINSQQWDGFELGVRAAAEEFAKVDRDFHDPFAYSVAIGIVRDGNGDRKLLDQLYQRQVAAFPTYWPAYGLRGDIVNTKWFGKPGELSSYVKGLLADPGGENGHIAYFEIARTNTNACCMDRQKLLEDTGYGYSWPELKKAYEITEARYGLTNSDWNIVAKLAMLAHDRESVKLALTKMDRRDPDVWFAFPYWLAVLYGKYNM